MVDRFPVQSVDDDFLDRIRLHLYVGVPCIRTRTYRRGRSEVTAEQTEHYKSNVNHFCIVWSDSADKE